MSIPSSLRAQRSNPSLKTYKSQNRVLCPQVTSQRWLKIAGILLLLLWSPFPYAANDLYTFSTPAKKERFQHILNNLRCLVCQNQALADSSAPIAEDLRREVAALIEKHESDQQVIDFLVQRYGNFVLYKPPLNKTTYLLWLGPILLFLIGIIIIRRVLRK